MSAKAQNGISPEIEQAINHAVGAAFAVAQRTQSAVANHSNTALPAASTVAVTGTAGALTGILTGVLTPKVTGKFRIHVHGVVTPLNTAAHKVTLAVAYANGTGALPGTTTTVQNLLNPIGMPLTTAGVEGGAGFGWTVETTAIGVVGTTFNAAILAFGDDTTSLQVSGGGAQITIEEIL